MEAYRYFGLTAPPFEGRPDPGYYHPAPSHAETLATLQYAVHCGKTCTLTLGDSGSGKTLLARVLAANTALNRELVWIHGLGQPPDRLNIAVSRPGLNRRSDDEYPASTERTLGEWLRDGLPRSPGAIVVVDNADGLGEMHWQHLMALMTREIRAHRPVSVLLFGLPELVNTLARPDLVRLQRRVFRTCRIAVLGRADLADYVQHRLRVAGAPGKEVFSTEALDLIQRFSAGNPALVNQLCDNAMVDAFAEDRPRIVAADVIAAVEAITGGVKLRRYLPQHDVAEPSGAVRHFAAEAPADAPEFSAPLPQPVRPPLREPQPGARAVAQVADAPPFQGVLRPRRRVAAVRIADPGPATAPAEPERHDQRLPAGPDERQSFAALVAQGPAPELAALTIPVERCVLDATPERDATARVDERLQALELRLAHALSRVREARARPRGLPDPESAAPELIIGPSVP